MTAEWLPYGAYLRLLGLAELAAQHTRSQRAAIRAAAELVGQADDGYGYFGHVSDELCDDRPNVDTMLTRMGISVGEPPEGVDREKIARAFHEAYEELAPNFGYETREASRTAWEDVPPANRKLMVATVEKLLGAGVIR